MIVINYRSGSLGFFLLSVLYHLWPSRRQGFAPGILSNNQSNHHIRPDLFIDRHDAVTPDQHRQLKELQFQSCIIMVHNHDLIKHLTPPTARRITILCSAQDIVTATFLFWIKCRKFVLHNAQSRNPNDIYQGLRLELVRCLGLPFNTAPGTVVPFLDLGQPDSMQAVIQEVTPELGPPQQQLDVEWYHTSYGRAMSPVRNYQRELECFSAVVQQLQHPKNSTDTAYMAGFRRQMQWFVQDPVFPN